MTTMWTATELLQVVNDNDKEDANLVLGSADGPATRLVVTGSV